MSQKERKMNYTFTLKPSTKELLAQIAIKKNMSMAEVFENMIIEKAKKIKLIN